MKHQLATPARAPSQALSSFSAYGRSGKTEAVIAKAVEQTPGAMLVMGAYGHSPIRTLIVGSTTTTMIRTVHVPVLLVR